MTQKILFLGVPGAGKGTQAKLLENKGFYHIGTGDLIREAFNSNNSLIIKYKEIINDGGLLPDKLIFKLIEKATSDFSSYILDGAVRTIDQAQYALDNKLLNKVIFFTLTKEEAEKRLLNRNEGRADDNIESIKKRFEEYNKKTLPIIDFLKKKGIEVIEIDASPEVEEIHKKVLKVLYL